MLMRTLFLSGLMLLSTSAQAGDAKAGKAKSENCSACHGDNGKEDPPIAGMSEAAFSKAIKDFQTGARASTSKKMVKSVKDLSDDDIANLAAYYLNLK